MSICQLKWQLCDSCIEHICISFNKLSRELTHLCISFNSVLKDLLTNLCISFNSLFVERKTLCVITLLILWVRGPDYPDHGQRWQGYGQSRSCWVKSNCGVMSMLQHSISTSFNDFIQFIHSISFNLIQFHCIPFLLKCFAIVFFL